MLDEKSGPDVLDHIGWLLWQAAQNWTKVFETRMIAAGYPWFGEARAAVLMHLTQRGTPQSRLVQRMGLSKQAVQQLVDQLVEGGIIQRLPDPADKRGKLLVFTAAGLQLLHDANRIKQDIEESYREKLGPAPFAALRAALTKLNAQTAPGRA